MPPVVSIIVPTLNSAGVLARCLEAIRAQDFDGPTELIIADGGSSDETRAIAERFGADQILDNPRRTGEAAKAVGLSRATGEFIAFIDSDNFLVGKDWLRRMIAPFREEGRLILTEPLYFHWNRSDPPIIRYCALMGINDPLCFYCGNFDRYNHATGRWTGLDVPATDRGDWIAVELHPGGRIPTLGANGTIYRHSVLRELPPSDYFFDVDIPRQLAASQPRLAAKVKCDILHWYCPKYGDFLRKQRRRIRDYYAFSHRRVGGDFAGSYSKRGLLAFVASTCLVFPALWTSLRGCLRKPDPAWFLHWPLCLTTLWIYAAGVLFRPHQGRRGSTTDAHG